MSVYYAAQVRFNAGLEPTPPPGASPDGSPGGERVRSSVLADLARTITVPAAISLRQLEATWAAVTTTVPQYATVLAAAAGAEFRRAQHVTRQARTAMAAAASKPDHLAAAAAAQLRAALMTAAAELGRQERLLVAAIAAQACGNLGYAVTRHDGRSVTGVEGRREGEIVLISVAHQGATEFDHAGLVEGACLDRQATLEREMSRLGADVVTTDRVPHGDARGGALISAAAARRRESLAHGVVGVKEGAPTRPAASLRGDE